MVGMARRALRSLLPQDRPREKLAYKGPQALSDTELAAIILGSGTKDRDVLKLADDLVVRLKSLQQTGKRQGTNEIPLQSNVLFDAIRKISGIGPVKAGQVAAAFELARRHLDNAKVRIRRPEDILPLVSFIADRMQEHLVCVSLNGAHEVISIRVVTVGTLTESLVHPREVFADPIAERAAAVILVHNHPSGDPEPSEADRRTSQRLHEAGKILGIEVLDHLILGGGRCLSIAKT